MTRRFLAAHPIVLQIGKTVFVHGGVLPEHVEYGLQRINEETQEWMEGRRTRMPRFLGGRSAIVWAREYSAEDERRCRPSPPGPQDIRISLNEFRLFVPLIC